MSANLNLIRTASLLIVLLFLAEFQTLAQQQEGDGVVVIGEPSAITTARRCFPEA